MSLSTTACPLQRVICPSRLIVTHILYHTFTDFSSGERELKINQPNTVINLPYRNEYKEFAQNYPNQAF